jgi:diguanylate cyclase
MIITEIAPILAFCVAVLTAMAYLFSRGSRRAREQNPVCRETQRAKAVIRELENISSQVHRSLAAHHASLLQFRSRIDGLTREGPVAWRELSEEAERMLRPTMRLSHEMAHAYDEIRQQTNLLMSFTDAQTDPLTGLNNRRSMEKDLKTLFAMKARYNTDFSLAIIDLDHFKQLNDEHGHLFGDQMLQQFAELLDKSVRETDTAARFGGEEFIVIMPHTDLNGACVFAERLRQLVESSLPVTVSMGVTGALDDDSTQTLLTRADAALYAAKSAGRNRAFRHTGQGIEPVCIGKADDRPDSQHLDATIDHGTEETVVELDRY